MANLGTSLIWLIIFPPMTFVSNYIIDEIGLRPGVNYCFYFSLNFNKILIGNTLTILGLWVRTFSKDSFYYIFAGQTLGAIGGPCILNTPQKISAVWYPPEEVNIFFFGITLTNPREQFLLLFFLLRAQ